MTDTTPTPGAPDGDDEFDAELDPELLTRLDDLDEDLAEQRAASLRAGLADYELEDDDLELLDATTEGVDGIVYLPALPVLAIVGRPNVGKSALVNRILGRREAVVEDVPGVNPTRRASTPRSPRRPRSPSTSPMPCCSSSTSTSGRPRPTSTSCGCCGPPSAPSSSSPTRPTTP
jgi:hypothetical protein